ncbi:hypothetical protein D9619_010528 [Psilocybe cf. subviscida]|uniref:Uncharacterized protein n=1 Tax=Psilocybe cf. subviscida TaxID=2480587 RepID=A0A8H5ERP0_9AGAR|nr:hypothetical protein D9619_010528 [Psilocybe cf. subviscida]
MTTTPTQAQVNKASIVSFPSLAHALNSLPQANNLQQVQLHHNMYAQRHSESEAKLQKAFLSKTVSNMAPPMQPHVYQRPAPPDNSADAPITMRTKRFTTSGKSSISAGLTLAGLHPIYRHSDEPPTTLHRDAQKSISTLITDLISVPIGASDPTLPPSPSHHLHPLDLS